MWALCRHSSASCLLRITEGASGGYNYYETALSWIPEEDSGPVECREEQVEEDGRRSGWKD